jgi:hypothetical protein
MDMDWKSIIDNGGIAICSAEEAQAKGVYPNRLGWLKEDPKIGAVIVFQSETDFAFGKNSLEYVTKAKVEKRLKEAYVVLVRGGMNDYHLEHLEYINDATIEKIKALVHNIRPRGGSGGSSGGSKLNWAI